MDSSYLRSLRDQALEGQFPVFNAAQGRFVLGGPVPGVAPTVVQNYFVATTGSDATGDGSQANPWATPQFAVSKVVERGGPSVIHFASGTYTRPILNNISFPLCFAGDGAGQVGDDGFTVNVAAQASQAGTGAGVVVGAGFVLDAQVNRAIRMRTGAAAGQLRTIVRNTVTDLIPARNFDPAPAPGDLFEIVSAAVIFNGFDPAVSSNETWIQQCAAPLAGNGTIAMGAVPPPASIPDGIYFYNIALTAAGVTVVRVLASTVYAYGLAGDATIILEPIATLLSLGQDNLNGGAFAVAALLGFASGSFIAGFTLQQQAAGSGRLRATSSAIQGYMSGGGITCRYQTLVVGRGGRLNAAIAANFGSIVHLNPTAAPEMRINPTAGSGALILVSASLAIVEGDAVTQLSNTSDVIRASEGSRVRASGACLLTSTAGSAVNVSQGGQIYIAGSPNGQWVGLAGADVRVDAATTQTAAFFAAIDTTLVSPSGNGSLATRVS